MKLKERTWKDKTSGEDKYAYSIGKINEFGEGIMADQEYSILLAFDIQVRRQPWVDPKTKASKVIVSVNATGKINPAFENVKYNSYENAQFQLSDKLEPILKDAKKGDTIFFALKSFDVVDKATGKTVKKTKWIGSVNQRLDFTDKKKGVSFPSKPNPISPTASQHPADIQEVISFCLKNGQAFAENFRVGQGERPQAFIDWVNGMQEVTTKYDDGQLIALYLEIVDLVK